LKQVKRHLILGHLIDQEKLSIGDDELEAAFQSLADNFKQPVEEIKRFYRGNEDKLDHYKHALLEKKALKLIFDSSTIENLPPEATA
jgi:trigger factor